MQLKIINTTVVDHIKFDVTANDDTTDIKDRPGVSGNFDKDNNYWKQNRLDTLSRHEQSIYLMADSLQKNRRYRNNTRIINALGIGYWDIDNMIRIGPVSSFISTNSTEGLRSRVGLWTLPGFSKKININGYIAYGTKDKKFKGHLGLQYLWNADHWTKTSLNAFSDYDYLLERGEELDNDNLLTSLLRKNIPTSRTFVKSFVLKHEQYLGKNLSVNISAGYSELQPTFNFSFHPLSKITELPIDSINNNRLPVAESSVGFRYSKNERTSIFNYDRVRLDNYNPIFTANFIYSIEAGGAQFSFQKINLAVEQRLRLPPKALLFYRIGVGKTFGMTPYLLLDVPRGNETYVDSRYEFNTMIPYEYAADQYIDLHARLYTGGVLFDKLPLINKLGWRERFSLNAYAGGMSDQNRAYNNKSLFSVTGKKPFLEAGVGIEIFFIFYPLIIFGDFQKLLHSTRKKKGCS